MPKKDDYRKKLVDEFLKVLEQPEIDYYCPWLDLVSQKNGVTNHKYKGCNALYLNHYYRENKWTDSRWFTYSQLKSLNESRNEQEKYSVEGQHGFPVEFFTVYDVVEKKKINLESYYKIIRDASDDEELKNLYKRYRVHNEYTTVFNAHQIKNMELIDPEKMALKDIESKEIVDVAKSINVKLSHESINKAYYNRLEDAVHLPLPNFFKSQIDYIQTAFHELSHSTGHTSRLGRDMEGTFGSEKYALEELIAEISSSFLGFNVNKDTPKNILDNHKAYIQSWAKVLKNEPNKFFEAVSQAQRAADYIEKNYEKYKEKTIEYKKLIDDFILDKTVIKNTNDQIKISDNSFGLNLIQANEKAPLMITGSALHKILYGKHKNSINPQLIKNIAEHIKDDSVLGVEGFGTSKDKFAIFIDVKDKDNKPVLIGLSVGKEILSEQILINEIVTVFGKEDIQSYLNNAVSHSSKIFMNKKSNLWLASNGLQLPNEASKVLTGYSSNIPSQNNDVKLPSAKEVEEAIERAGRKPLNLKKYQDKANEHNKELKKNVASLEVKKDEEEI